MSKELIIAEIEKVTSQVKESIKDLKRVALSEVWKILQLVIASAVQTIESIADDLSGQDKKQIAMDYISRFYDSAFLVVDIPFVPPILEPIIHRYIKSILMVMVSSSIDATVTIFRETGIFLKKGNK